MAMGKRNSNRQPQMWVATTDVPVAPSHPFYARLNRLFAVYANRRRIRGARGQRLLRKRGELLERPSAHLYETGGMRRTHLRGHNNILKRLLVHASACNLGLWMRTACGVGTPRGLQGRIDAQMVVLVTLLSPSWLASRSGSVDKPICA